MRIERGRSVYEGVKLNDQGDICCEVCGAMKGFREVMHLDGTDFWESDLKCQCGNIIARVTQRTEEEMLLWMDDTEEEE